MPSTTSTWPAAFARLAQRHAGRAPQLLEVALVVLVALALGSLVWKFFPEPDVGNKLPANAIEPAQPAQGRQGPNIDLITGATLFGKEVIAKPKPPPQPKVSAENAPDTQLKLKLLGILAATEDQGSRALIGTPNGDEKPYSIGDNIVSGASLHSIFPDRVLLSRGGALEALRLDKDAPSKAVPNRRARQPNRRANSRSGNAHSVTPEAAKLVSTIRDQILSDPSTASKFIRVQPASSGGRIQGYRLYPGRDRKAFTAVGLRPGDLITQVNGIQLNDANTALQMLTQVSQANSVSVVIKRGGKEQTMNLNLN